MNMGILKTVELKYEKSTVMERNYTKMFTFVSVNLAENIYLKK